MLECDRRNLPCCDIMAKQVKAGGGLAAVRYTLRKAREAGGVVRLTRRLQSHNACKTCAVGMGGQRGGMHNEQGSFPEVCKKSVQAQAADMQPPIAEAFFADAQRRRPRALERARARGRRAASASRSLWRAGETHFRRITWDEAYGIAAAALRATPPARSFFYSSGRSSNEAAFLLQCFARVFGTNNVNNCSYYCHQASGVALQRAIGSGTATVALDDLERADLAVVIGANPASNHPRLITQLINLRRRGGKVIVINPLKEIGLVRFRVPSDWRSMLFGSEVCDLYLQPHVGGDIALLKLLLKGIVERGQCDRDFLAAHVDGWDAVEADVRAASRQALLAACGVPPADVDAAVRLLRRVARDDLRLGDGHHAARARRRQRPGHRQSGAEPRHARQARRRAAADPRPQQRAGRRLGRRQPGAEGRVRAPPAGALRRRRCRTTPGLAHAGVGRSGGSRRASTPPSCSAATSSRPHRIATGPAQALRKIGTTVYVTTKLNEGHIHGRGRTCLILPVLARDEERQCTTQESMFNYVRLSDGGARGGVGGDAAGGGDHRHAWRAWCCRTGPVDFAALARPRARFAPPSPPSCRATKRSARSTATQGGVPDRRADLARAALQHRVRQGARRGHAGAGVAARGRRVPPDDAALRGAVQHRRLRGRGHLPRQRAARRRHDERRRRGAAAACSATSGSRSSTTPVG